MSVASVLARGRRAADATMTDVCLIQRPVGAQYMDPDTLSLVDAFDTVYDGPCRVQGRGLVGQAPEAGGTVHVVAATELQLPAASTAEVLPNDVVTLTASAANPGLVGRTMRLGAEAVKSHGTKRVFAIKEAQ